MSDKLKQTVRIVRQSKVKADDRGRNVWSGPIEEVELELVSTAKLKQVLKSMDETRKRQIREVAAGKEGVLVHDPENDRFEIVDDTDIEAALELTPKLTEATKTADVELVPLTSLADTGDEELSLVSTLALRRILKSEDVATDDEQEALPPDTGFDPYDSN